MKRFLFSTFLMVLLAFPLASLGTTLSLTKDGPRTAREGDLVEFSLEVVNEGTTSVAGIAVLDTLPAEVQFVQAMPTPDGTYNSITGVWTLPTLGTGTNDKTAGLQLQALVNQNLINNPDDVVGSTNRVEVIAPPDQTPLETKFTTNIICSSCIDWEIVSIKIDVDTRHINIEGFEARFFLRVNVANNGPVPSDATVSVTHFDIRGGGFGAVELFPDIPVAVTLDPGQTQTIEFKTDWEEGDDSTYTVSWEFEVRDVALLDPILPNTSAGSWKSTAEHISSDGCFFVASAHGSYLAPHIVTLRDFRDRYFLTNPIGKWFVKFYYYHSPPIADYIRVHKVPRTIVRSILTLIVYSIEYPITTLLILLVPPIILIRQRKQLKNRAV
jgi:uncharacterized repeat protein (TIGR01451 family)